MPKKRKLIPGLDPVRKFPYYKIQYRDETLSVWKDIQKSFTSLNSLFRYAGERLNRSEKTRIMKVTGYGAREIMRSYTAFGISIED